MKKLAIIAVIAAIAASCAKEIAPVAPVSGELVNLEFSAGVEATKTAFDGTSYLWEETDKMAVFDGAALNEFSIKTLNAGGKGAIFEGTAAVADSYVAIAPFGAASLSGTAVSVTIPEVQNIVDDRVVDSNALVSISGTNGGDVYLSNMFSLVKLKLETDDIMSVSIFGNNDEAIAGTAKLGGDLTLGAGNSKTVTLTYGDEETFPVGEYYAVIYPTDFTAGFRVVVTNADGAKSCKTIATQKVFERNGGMNLKTVDDSAAWVDGTITTYDQLKMFARMAPAYEGGETVKLGADIDCGGEEWTPVDLYCNFDGQNHHIYNYKVTQPKRISGFFSMLASGRNVNLKNVCFGSSDYNFADMTGTYDGFTRYVHDSDAAASSWSYCGAACGYAYAGSVIENVVNFAPVSLNDACQAYNVRMGGISGTMKANVTIKDCVNFAKVTFSNIAATTQGSDNSSVGGIVGCIDGVGSQVVGCENYGAVSNESIIVQNIGGVVGFSQYESLISECHNAGEVTNNAASGNASGSGYGVRVGGVCGAAIKAGIVLNKCSNEGSVLQACAVPKNGICVGGVLGTATAAITIKGCSNSSSLFGTSVEVTTAASIGGIVGYINNAALVTKADDGTLTVNSGNYTQGGNFVNKSFVGGIAGYVNTEEAIIEYCLNSGDMKQSKAQVTAKIDQYIAGIVAYSRHIVRHCENTGYIYGGSISSGTTENQTYHIIGGIAATVSNNAGAEVSDCVNRGTIQIGKGKGAHMYAGGIAGRFVANVAVMKDCRNEGTIHITRGNDVYAGGLVGGVDVNTTAAAITNFCGCSSVSDNDFSPTCWDKKHSGALFGFLNSTPATEELIIGSEAEPVTVKGSISVAADDTHPEPVLVILSEENYRQYIFGKIWYETAPDTEPAVNYLTLNKINYNNVKYLN